MHDVATACFLPNNGIDELVELELAPTTLPVVLFGAVGVESRGADTGKTLGLLQLGMMEGEVLDGNVVATLGMMEGEVLEGNVVAATLGLMEWEVLEGNVVATLGMMEGEVLDRKGVVALYIPSVGVDVNILVGLEDAPGGSLVGELVGGYV
jgi:hypothetical protein